ncbi:MAG: hypothetical protein HKN89_05815 [Eudoraea sp.]|nr:hypothetical protein [Eudoraea sp.]
MQTIGKYFAALVLAVLSSFSDAEPAEETQEKETVIKIQIIKLSPCATLENSEDTLLFI